MPLISLTDAMRIYVGAGKSLPEDVGITHIDNLQTLRSLLTSGYCPRGVRIYFKPYNTIETVASLTLMDLTLLQLKDMTDIWKDPNCPNGLFMGLTGCLLGISAIKIICEALQTGQCKPYLSLGLSQIIPRNGEGSDCGHMIGRLLKSGRCPEGLTLDLSKNFLGDYGAYQIADAIAEGNCPANMFLNLSDNGFSAHGFRAIINSLHNLRKKRIGLPICLNILTGDAEEDQTIQDTIANLNGTRRVIAPISASTTPITDAMFADYTVPTTDPSSFIDVSRPYTMTRRTRRTSQTSPVTNPRFYCFVRAQQYRIVRTIEDNDSGFYAILGANVPELHQSLRDFLADFIKSLQHVWNDAAYTAMSNELGIVLKERSNIFMNYLARIRTNLPLGNFSAPLFGFLMNYRILSICHALDPGMPDQYERNQFIERYISLPAPTTSPFTCTTFFTNQIANSHRANNHFFKQYTAMDYDSEKMVYYNNPYFSIMVPISAKGSGSHNTAGSASMHNPSF